jgi:hypothetical protein
MTPFAGPSKYSRNTPPRRATWARCCCSRATPRKRLSRFADELIEKYSRDSAFLIAGTNAWRGDKEQAFAWLERAYERHDSSFFNLKSEPRFASLLGDPHYHALLRKLNLPE